MQRDEAKGKDQSDFKRFPEERIFGNHLFVVLYPDPLWWRDDIPLSKADDYRSKHRTQNKEKEPNDPGRRELVELPFFFIEEPKDLSI